MINPGWYGGSHARIISQRSHIGQHLHSQENLLSKQIFSELEENSFSLEVLLCRWGFINYQNQCNQVVKKNIIVWGRYGLNHATQTLLCPWIPWDLVNRGCNSTALGEPETLHLYQVWINTLTFFSTVPHPHPSNELARCTHLFIHWSWLLEFVITAKIFR